MAEINEKPYWAEKQFSFFSHRTCEYFPCHKTQKPEEFNCLFCYCPLYALGRNCGGNFHYTEDGIKDCSDCLLPHRKESYGYITGRFQDIVAQVGALERMKEGEPGPGRRKDAQLGQA